ncbi:MAG: undecaprenyl-diphosphatase UppP, partial [Candidatus Kerfeldbacteria bacterium]|nr:undecaprenyl-diphosphatase UppP [Candidatus Kerfeldbacteria bacterium]
MTSHLFDASLLGVIQGLGEFLPISSSGHLLLAHYFLDYQADNSLTFDVALHIGTFIALIVYFWRDIGALFGNFVRSWRQRPWTPELRLPWLIIIAAIPAAIVGGLFDSFFETIRNPWVVVVTFLVFGALFIWTERRRSQNTELVADINWKTALAIGVAQVLALVPGVSRSGITIITGMWAGLRRDQAARFTFLLSIPVVAGAAAKKFLDLRQTGIPDDERVPMLVGIAVAAVVGYAVIRFLLRYLGHHKLNVFAYYRFAVAIVVA